MLNKMKVIKSVISILAMSSVVFGSFGSLAQGSVRDDVKYTVDDDRHVTVYSYRSADLMEPLFDAFTKKTGIKVRTLHSGKGLLNRLKAEGRYSPADVVLTVDASRLYYIDQEGLFADIKIPQLERTIPAQYRHPDGRWYGLSLRARLMVVNSSIPVGALQNYEDLADPKWRGLVCTRDGTHVYQLGLVGGMLYHHGYENTKLWLNGVKSNLARRPAGNDRAQIKGVSSGVCGIALVNSYYLTKMRMSPEQAQYTENIRVIFPNQSNYGTHVNLTGGGILKTSKNKHDAMKLLAFLGSKDAQLIYSNVNGEYSVLEDLGTVHSYWYNSKVRKFDDVPMTDLVGNYTTALRLVTQVDYNG